MFRSHLDAPHHATHELLAGHPGMGAASDVMDPASAVQNPSPGATDQPAPMPMATAPIVFAGMTSKQLLLAGGIAVAVFLLLKVFVKR